MPHAAFATTCRGGFSLAAFFAFCVLQDASLAEEGASEENRRQDNFSIESLAEGFQNPPVDSRPFVRWWWNDNRVEPNQLLRELDLLKSAGIGGVEINPIQSREQVVKSAVKPLVWRSRQWDEMLHVACKGAAERGMVVDVIAGSGWPFGGKFLKPDEQIMRMAIVDQRFTGPQSIRIDLKLIEAQVRRTGERRKTSAVDLHSIQTYPVGIQSANQVTDVTHCVNDKGELMLDLSEGEFVVSFAMRHQGYREVFLGTPGADGPTMDHYQRDVTRAYLNRLKGVEETWGEPLSTYVRSVFCDSIETAKANWTHGILESFKTSKGYDIAPYLPFALVPESESMREDCDAEFLDRIRRVRYDWSEHLAYEFRENFIKEFAQFFRDNDLLSRFQAYGSPWHIGMAEGYMLPDIPESNNWVKVDPWEEDRFTSDLNHGYMVWSKYASAGGRLTGKKIVSIEAMTSIDECFERSLSTIKQADDMNFITGMNHSVLHGFNSVPLDVPFPGLVRFGTFFSEHNPWWPYLRKWTDYNARLSFVMQNTTPTPEVAIIGPTPDVWSVSSFAREPFHESPAYLHRIWEALAQLGGDCDYLHADVIENADFADGLLRYGPMSYQALIVTEMKTMRPETAEAIQRFAESGGKVVFVGDLPSRSPGLRNAPQNDKHVRTAATAAVASGALRVAPPANEAGLRPWAADAIKQLGIQLNLSVDQPRDGLYQIRKTIGDQDVLFFTNTYQLESSRTHVSIDLGDRGLWRWDPETGQRTPYELPYGSDGFELDLRPIESLLLITGEKQAPESSRQVSRDDVPSIVIDSPWTITFHCVNEAETFEMKMPQLSDFSASDIPRVKRFSGTAIYETAFNVTDLLHTHLHLGRDQGFISEVQINGKDAGVNWYGSKLFDISPFLKMGENRLTIRYTTTLTNMMKPPKPSGILGPVRLLRFSAAN
jgi:hypothetical protein